MIIIRNYSFRPFLFHIAVFTSLIPEIMMLFDIVNRVNNNINTDGLELEHVRFHGNQLSDADDHVGGVAAGPVLFN